MSHELWSSTHCIQCIVPMMLHRNMLYARLQTAACREERANTVSSSSLLPSFTGTTYLTRPPPSHSNTQPVEVQKRKLQTTREASPSPRRKCTQDAGFLTQSLIDSNSTTNALGIKSGKPRKLRTSFRKKRWYQVRRRRVRGAYFSPTGAWLNRRMPYP